MLLSADMLWAGEWGLCSRWKKKKSKHKSKSWNLVLHLLCNRCCLGAILGSFKPMLKVKGALKKKKKACIYAWCLLSVSKPWGEEFHHLLAENLKPTNPSPAEIKPLWTVNYQSLCFALKFSFPLEKDLFKNPLVSRTLGRSRRRRKGVRVRAVPQRVTCWGEVCGRWRDVSYSPAAGQHHLLSYDICLPADGRGLCSEGDKHGLLLRKKKKKREMSVYLTCIAVVLGSLISANALMYIFRAAVTLWMRDSDWPEFWWRKQAVSSSATRNRW